MNSFFKLIAIIVTTLSISNLDHAAASDGGNKDPIEKLETALCELCSKNTPLTQIVKNLPQEFRNPSSRSALADLYRAFKGGGEWKSLAKAAYPTLFSSVSTDVRLEARSVEDSKGKGKAAAATSATTSVPALPGISEQAMEITKQLQEMGLDSTTATIEQNLDVLELEDPHLRLDVARALNIKPPLSMIKRLPSDLQINVAKKLEAEGLDELLREKFLSQRIYHNEASTWFSGFEKHKNTPLCPHYRRAFPKIPVVHQYNPEVSTDGGRVPLVFNVNAQLHSLLPARVQAAIKPALEIGIVFQSMQQLTAGGDGLCFRPQTWISSNGAAFSGSTTIQWLEPDTDKALSLSSGYSIHDGVSSPNGPRLPTKPANDPFVCWSRTQWNARSILTAHVFVPFGMETLLRRFELRAQAPQTVGAFYDALLDVMDGFEREVREKIRTETAIGKAPTEDDVWISSGEMQAGVRRVFEEDLGDLFPRR